MNTTLLPLGEYEAPPVPVNVTSEPGTMGAPGRVSARRRTRGGFLLAAGLIGSVAVVSAWHGARQVGQATRAPLIPPAQAVWTDARITTLGSRSMGLVTEDGRKWALGLDFNNTSVFQKGGVLNVTHLRLGQQVKFRSSLRDGKSMAQAVEIKLQSVLPGV